MKYAAGFLCAAGVIAMTVAIGGCGGNNGGGGGIVGTWRITQTGKDAVGEVNCPGQLLDGGGGVIDTCAANDTVTFNADGTYSTNDADPQSGTYTFVGGVITLNLIVNGQIVFTTTGNITLDADGNHYTFRETINGVENGRYEKYIRQ